MAARKDTRKESEQKFVLRLPEDFHRALRHVAIDRGVSLNRLILEVLEQWWAKHPEHAVYAKRGAHRR
jgi:predicted HicB family RNase H-like nuclease